LSITFAEIATHNHFVLDRGGNVFKQTAPAIKLRAEMDEQEYLRVLGALNSSLSCFWLKQKSYPKSGDSVTWANRYAFNGKTVEAIPMPDNVPIEIVRMLDDTARLRADSYHNFGKNPGVLWGAAENAGDSDLRLKTKLIALQEELDWGLYKEYGISDSELVFHELDQVPGVLPGQRAFEIVLAREVQGGQGDPSWFVRHGIEPIVEIPLEWPENYRQLVQRRIGLIESDSMIGMLERPEYKRRWAEEPWVKRQERALRGWLLDRIESREHWFDRRGRPSVRSVGQLADALGREDDIVSVLELWSGQRDVDLVAMLTKLLTEEVVPYLASWRLKEPALRKWEEWKTTWDLQRREDKGEDVGPIPVPPKYTTADFRKQSYWSHRGKLDVPKERFIVYPEAELSTDRSMLLGWAGWNHAEQFLALASHMDRMTADGAGDDRLVPVLAGLHELMPWVQQWHGELDPAYGVSLGDFAAQEVEQRRARLGVSFDDLVGWRPPKATRGRRKKAS
ncbi:MAG: BREX-2 system adenine-specific DNA-methyltransferase PglX, partial [Kocuria palustris]